jgi:hypothetical protein
MQREGNTRLRCNSNALLLTAAMVWFINGLHSRPDDGSAARDLMRAILPRTDGESNLGIRPEPRHYESGSDDDDDDDSDDEGVPHAPCGLIFLREVILPPTSTVPRMRIGRSVKDTTFKFFLGGKLQDIQSQVLPTNILTKKDIPATRVSTRKAKTPTYYNFDGQDDPIFQLSEAGYELPNPSVDVGSDLEVEEQVHDDNQDIDGKLTQMWYQFLLDIIAKAPNPRGATNPSYCITPTADRLKIRDAFFQNRKLSDVWRACQYKVADQKLWTTAFGHLWPAKGHVTGLAVQNYRTCTYYVSWKQLLAEVDDATAKAIRAQMKKKFDELYWIPAASSDKVWNTKRAKGFAILPDGWSTAAPQLLVLNQSPEWQ